MGGFRSGGALTSKGAGAAGAPDRPKARRKRTYRLGGKAAAASPPASRASHREPRLLHAAGPA